MLLSGVQMQLTKAQAAATGFEMERHTSSKGRQKRLLCSLPAGLRARLSRGYQPSIWTPAPKHSIFNPVPTPQSFSLHSSTQDEPFPTEAAIRITSTSVGERFLSQLEARSLGASLQTRRNYTQGRWRPEVLRERGCWIPPTLTPAAPAAALAPYWQLLFYWLLAFHL